MPKISTTKLMLVITESIALAAEAVRKHDEETAEEILKYTLFRWLQERPLTMHTMN